MNSESSVLALKISWFSELQGHLGSLTSAAIYLPSKIIQLLCFTILDPKS